MTRLGAVRSATVTAKVPLAVLPPASRAVTLITVRPSANSVSFAREYSIVTGPEASVAVAPT